MARADGDERVQMTPRRSKATLGMLSASWWGALRRKALTRGQTRARLHYLATHDLVTGLPNRTLFLKRLAEALGRPDDGTQAVLCIDIDDFKNVNDQFGHRVGDTL